MNKQLKFKLLEEIRKEAFYWTAELNTAFDLEENGNHILREEEAYLINLIDALELFSSKTQEIETRLGSIIISSKYLSNYKKTLERLFRSTDLEQLKFISNNPLKGNLIDLLKDKEISIKIKIHYVSLINKALENNWVAFNQSYARLLYKLVNINELRI